MAKKLPLKILTLITIIGVGAISVPNVGATGDRDPWSFDELFAAKENYVNQLEAQCPKVEHLRNTCGWQLMEEMGALYSIGVSKSASLQVSPISMDFTNNTLEYYSSSESFPRNYYWQLPYTDHYVKKLVIVQVKKAYSMDWTTPELAEGNESPKWQVLYKGEKSDSELSLLPTDQRATLTINKPSFDSEYDQNLRVFVESTNGDTMTYKIDFDDCVDGRKYDVWYNLENPSPFFKDYSFSDGREYGYNEGYLDGQNAGQAAGYAAGYDDGHQAGKDDGYDQGYDDGLDEGLSEGYQDGFDEGLDQGYRDGFDEGYDNGYVDGRDTGYWEGHDDGYMTGRDEGWLEGREIGYDEGYGSGYDNGFDNGYSTGYNAARSQNQDSGGNTDGGPDSGAGTDSDSNSGAAIENNNTNQAINDGISIQNTNSISLESGSLSNPKSKFAIKTPNTGSMTQGNHAIEFPWWLGAIFTLGTLALIWLFIPKHKKSHKKS